MPPQTQYPSQSSTIKATENPQPNLLIPTKRPLLLPSSKKTLNPSSQPAHISIKPSHEPTTSSSAKESTTAATTTTTTERQKHKPITTLEVDLSGAPQPFLDPGAWLNMKVVAEGEMEMEGKGEGAEGVEGVEERERREREREAGREFGGMAVWSRRDVRRRGRRGLGRDR